MAIEKPTLYKMVTPPKGEGGGMGSLVKSMNSLGGTINSIAFIAADMNKNFAKGIKHQISKQEDISKKHTRIENQKLADRKKKENALRKLMNRRQDQDAEDNQKASLLGRFGGTLIKAAKGALGFFEGIAKALEAIFTGFVQYAVFKWMANPANQKKIKKFLDFMSSLGKFIMWAVTGLVNMGLGGITDFLDNPVSFKGLFGLVKFLTALGLVFAPGATISLALSGVMGLFKAGRLIPLLKGFFTGVWGLVKGLLAFLSRRPLVAAGLLAAGWGAYMIWGRGDDEEDEMLPWETDENDVTTPNLEDKSDDEVLSAMDERANALQSQIDAMSWWKKLTTNEDDQLRKEIVQTKNESQTDTSSEVTKGEVKVDQDDEKLPEKKKGGIVIPSNPFVPKLAMGGWITGPQSGYPVSLDGGGSTSFIGHGTEWVGFPKASRGGAFVVPFDTPSTRSNPSLTKKRLGEAKRGGFAMPSFNMGGFYPQTNTTYSPQLSLPSFSEGGLTDGTNEEKWARVKAMAKKAGAKYPDLVAAQFALESDWGRAVGAKNNFFGIKALESELSNAASTWEVYGGKKVNTTANFKQFETPYAAIEHLVTQWYKDYKGYKGVNNAASAMDAAVMLKSEGYATDPIYSSKLQQLLTKYSKIPAARQPVVTSETIKPNNKAWWDPLGLFTGKPATQASSGNTLGEAALAEDLKTGSGANEESDVTVQPVQLPTVDATPPAASESISEPIFIPNDYEPPSNPYVQARFGLMADVTTEPSRLY